MKKKPKKFNLKSFIIALLRRGTYRFPFRNDALKAAKIERNKYICKLCNGVFPRRLTCIDHITPVVGMTGFTNFDDYIARMYPCDINAFQVLCISCHEKKTTEENITRRATKKNNGNN